MTKLAQFIARNIDTLVDEFETFARTHVASAEHLSSAALRDHAHLVLQSMAADMATAQPPDEQQAKGQGKAGNRWQSEVRKTSQLHAQHRFEQGFTLPEMVSEYRALRASIIRRWTAQITTVDFGTLDELTRLGEAVDEALTEAIAWYSKRLEDSRNLLIGVMAHDLRSPLSAVRMSADYLLRGDHLQDGDLRAATRIAASSTRIAGFVSDLLDFTQTLLGAGLQLNPTRVHLASLCEDLVDELRAAHPTVQLELALQAAPSGLWDAPRLSQLLSNLVTNAVIHGDAAQPITVGVAEGGGAALLTVHNAGEPIPAGALPNLFRPMQNALTARTNGSSGLSLGLHIAREIALAHGGSVTVVSEAAAGTTFTVRLPLA